MSQEFPTVSLDIIKQMKKEANKELLLVCPALLCRFPSSFDVCLLSCTRRNSALSCRTDLNHDFCQSGRKALVFFLVFHRTGEYVSIELF